jgi:hypothetical protein
MRYLDGLSYVFSSPFILDFALHSWSTIFTFVALALNVVHLTTIQTNFLHFGHRRLSITTLRGLPPAVQYPGSFLSPFSLAHFSASTVLVLYRLFCI